MTASLAALAYLVSGVLFILSLRGLSSPETSRQGNLYGMVGMALAIVTTLLTLFAQGLLDLTTDPPGATVSVNGEYAGETPFSAPVKAR